MMFSNGRHPHCPEGSSRTSSISSRSSICWLYLSLIKTFTGQMPPDPYEPQHCQPHGNYFNRQIMGTVSLI